MNPGGLIGNAQEFFCLYYTRNCLFYLLCWEQGVDVASWLPAFKIQVS